MSVLFLLGGCYSSKVRDALEECEKYHNGMIETYNRLYEKVPKKYIENLKKLRIKCIEKAKQT